MNRTFERLRLQAQLRRLIDQYGSDTALRIIEQAVERELKQSIPVLTQD